MKRRRIRVAVIVTSVLLIISIASGLYFTLPFRVFHSYESGIKYDKDEGVIRAQGNAVRILQITDLHVNGMLDMPLTFAIIKQLVRKAEPDLIVVTGDLFSRGCDEKDVETFITFMAELGLPWASVLGNHDDETPYSLEELSAILEEAENSLFKRGELSDLYGNYYYGVEFADGGEYKFIFMDSRSSGFTEESVAFYEEAVCASASDGGLTDSFLFYHIPLTEAYAAIENYESGRADGTGKIRETICDQDTEVGFFDKVVELGSTKAMIYGHDHYNDAKTKYQGVDFNYGTKTGTSAGNKIGLVGGTLYVLNSDGTYTFEDIKA